jgi:hypothetical protein
MRKEKPKFIYLVKREVIAHNIKEASEAKRRIYCIELVEEKSQPENKNIEAGFQCQKKKP